MHSKMHPYLDWAKAQLDEMDAALASLERTRGDVEADARIRAGEMLAGLRAKRDIFQDIISKQAGASEAILATARTKLELEWDAFEAQLRGYVEAFAKQTELQQTTFQLQANAQLKAWRSVAERLERDAGEFAAEGRNEIETSIKRMYADAAVAEEKLHKLYQAGTQSWSAMVAALSETRSSFDRANHKSADAFKRAVK